MPTLGTLVSRSEPGLFSLTEEMAGTSEVESALIVSDADLAGWPDADVDVFRRVLLILPLSAEPQAGRIEAAVRRIGGVRAAGVVLATGPAGIGTLDLGSLAASARRHRVPLLVASDDPARVWVRMMTIIREEREQVFGHAGDELREMHRESTRPDGLKRLLRWLARRVEGNVVLLDRAGAPLHAFPELPADVLEQAAGDIKRVVTGEVQAAAADFDGGVVHIQSIGEADKGPTLMVARKERFSPSVRGLVRDVSRLLALRWHVEDLGRRQRRMELAETRTREAVLQLLLVGQLQAARRVAGALGPSLADEIRVYVVEGPVDARDQSVAYCDRAAGGRAWIVRCPVYARHVIILAPAPDDAEELGETLRAYVGRVNGVDVGGSHTVALRDLASGYAQAFHALAVARGSDGHYARFSPRGDLVALLRARGHEWAKATLAPLTGYRPHRAQDPDSAELIATLRSWLAFYGAATRQMKIHRNTLAARMRHIEQLFGHSLDDLQTQSRLHLALCLIDGPGGDGGPAALEALLDDPEVRRWADMQVSPLLGRDPELFMNTLRVWLDSDARLEATASTLGISVPGARKRLTRIEEVLERSFVSGPTGRYEIWFALRVHDGLFER